MGAGCAFAASTTARAWSVSSRASPAPNSASTTKSRPSRTAADSGVTGPAQRAAMAAASPFSASIPPSNATAASQPAAARWRATTKPSPPLLPGPHRTATGHGAKRARISRATAAPAASIRRTPGMPPAIAAASAAAISATLSNACAFLSSAIASPIRGRGGAQWSGARPRRRGPRAAPARRRTWPRRSATPPATRPR